YLAPIHVAQWGVFVHSPEVSANRALVEADVSVANIQEQEASIEWEATLVAPDGATIATQAQKAIIEAAQPASLKLTFEVERPELWGLTSPALYRLRIRLRQKDRLLDEYTVPFGIRSVEFRVDKGFLLNGQPTLLKGACVHHDLGLLGAAAFKRAEYRRVKILKENGFNAIRCSHNPPSQHFLDACDQLGMLVIDEINDGWEISKRENDYHLHFIQQWETDLEHMIQRDRNHPSIIMWSYGNEVRERGMARGYEIGAFLTEKIRSLDPTRALTMGVNGFGNSKVFNWEAHTPPTFALMDVAGYNYQPQRYEADHATYPDRVIYGSESYPNQAFSYWKKVVDLPYVIGDFVWTGQDYLGESGIGISAYVGRERRLKHPQPWPWFNANCGDIDLIGNQKPQGYYRSVLWGESEIEILVHEPIPRSRTEQVGRWGWPNEEPSWTWPDYEGRSLAVNVYAHFEKVQLFLNDDLVGEQVIDLDSGITAHFKVPYSPGELRAVGLSAEGKTAEKRLQTVGEISGLKLTPGRASLAADRSEVLFIAVEAIDQRGRILPQAITALEVEVSGEAELIGAGNGSPLITSQKSFQSPRFQLHRGRGLIILRSTGNPGKVTLAVKS
ncbi:MAG: glycoside hydrolase family 2 TIM barrel-domain containing protein, partial [Bacteroidota bacterium]